MGTQKDKHLSTLNGKHAFCPGDNLPVEATAPPERPGRSAGARCPAAVQAAPRGAEKGRAEAGSRVAGTSMRLLFDSI